MDEDSGQNLVDGDGTVADYVQNTGGSGSPYVTNQSAYDVADNGLITSNAGTTTAPNGAPNGTTGSTQSQLPSWLSGITSLAGQVTTPVTQISNLINGKPATSGVSPGAQPVNGLVSPAGIAGFLPWLIGGGVLLFFLNKK